ncbi:hypothetical protein NLJ89_g10899 [Agrocybe chaxingu]|uniref:Uncharacterized protein n=1 Tax=Agrocybe chaxingu TaxID=84603 RepID=A0A9W8JMX9_9AGAR|nr:hypothetical protein NLJ89_g10899 [Agrocybe chaxingu]
MYRVFLGAPSKSEISNDPRSYSWRTLNSTSLSVSQSRPSPSPALEGDEEASGRLIQQTQSSGSLAFPFPLERLEEASRRVSLIYKDLVFREEEGEEEGEVEVDDMDEEESVLDLLARTLDEVKEMAKWCAEIEIDKEEGPSLQQEASTSEPLDAQVSVSRGVEQTTMLSWPPTASNESASMLAFSRANEMHSNLGGPSGFNFNSTTGPSFIFNISERGTEARCETQSRFLETQAESQSYQESRSISDANASIARFPSFHFNLNSLTPLSSLSSNAKNKLGPALPTAKTQRKVNLLVAILEVEGPDTIRVKKGVDAGKEVSVLKLILGEEDGSVGKLTAWREVAEEWGGAGKKVGVKRGDVVHFENVMATCDPASSTTFSASPYLKSAFTICYRAMPYTHEDGRLRPDLRLGASVPSVRKVAAVVRWFENMAGLAGPTR